MTTRQKIEGWIQGKIEALRSKGVTEAASKRKRLKNSLLISSGPPLLRISDAEIQKYILGGRLKRRFA